MGMAGSILPPVRKGPQKSAPVYKGPHMGLSWPIYGPQIGAAVRICGCRSLQRFFGCCPHRRPRFDVASARPGDDALINAVWKGLIDTKSSRPWFDDMSGAAVSEQAATPIVDMLLMPPGKH